LIKIAKTYNKSFHHRIFRPQTTYNLSFEGSLVNPFKINLLIFRFRFGENHNRFNIELLFKQFHDLLLVTSFSLLPFRVAIYVDFRVPSDITVDTLHIRYLKFHFCVLKLDFVDLPCFGDVLDCALRCRENSIHGFITLLYLLAILSDSLIHQGTCVLSSGGLLLLLEGVVNLFDLFVLVSEIEMLTSNTIDFFLRVELAYAL